MARDMAVRLIGKLRSSMAISGGSSNPASKLQQPIDLESSAAPPVVVSASTELAAGAEEAAAENNNNDNKNEKNDDRESRRSLMELLSPATFCTAIFASIPPKIQEDYRGFHLYEPLLGFIVLGVSTSAVAVFYDIRGSHPVASETAAGRKERPLKRELETDKLVETGLIFSLIALLFRVMLQLSVAALARVAAVFVTGGVVGALHFYCGPPPPR